MKVFKILIILLVVSCNPHPEFEIDDIKYEISGTSDDFIIEYKNSDSTFSELTENDIQLPFQIEILEYSNHLAVIEGTNLSNKKLTISIYRGNTLQKSIGINKNETKILEQECNNKD